MLKVSTWEIVETVRIFKGIFYLFVRVLFCLRQASMCPHETLWH